MSGDDLHECIKHFPTLTQKKSFIIIDSLCCCYIYNKRKQTHISKKDQTYTASKYFSVPTQFILILCFVYRLSHGESKSTTSTTMMLSMNMLRAIQTHLNMSRGGCMISKQVWMLTNIRNYEYDSILLVFLNTHCWSLAQELNVMNYEK